MDMFQWSDHHHRNLVSISKLRTNARAQALTSEITRQPLVFLELLQLQLLQMHNCQLVWALIFRRLKMINQAGKWREPHQPTEEILERSYQELQFTKNFSFSIRGVRSRSSVRFQGRIRELSIMSTMWQNMWMKFTKTCSRMNQNGVLTITIWVIKQR